MFQKTILNIVGATTAAGAMCSSRGRCAHLLYILLVTMLTTQPLDPGEPTQVASLTPVIRSEQCSPRGSCAHLLYILCIGFGCVFRWVWRIRTGALRRKTRLP
ncbi:hypothetical protein T484DRAFT_1933285 [Baffinella frigidus]|nr:hypothetical protein T484DRAFT_1933285 [Cryptophyta sp. CCMP2293]